MPLAPLFSDMRYTKTSCWCVNLLCVHVHTEYLFHFCLRKSWQPSAFLDQFIHVFKSSSSSSSSSVLWLLSSLCAILRWYKKTVKWIKECGREKETVKMRIVRWKEAKRQCTCVCVWLKAMKGWENIKMNVSFSVMYYLYLYIYADNVTTCTLWYL